MGGVDLVEGLTARRSRLRASRRADITANIYKNSRHYASSSCLRDVIDVFERLDLSVLCHLTMPLNYNKWYARVYFETFRVSE
jgi:hypothetical protein